MKLKVAEKNRKHTEALRRLLENQPHEVSDREPRWTHDGKPYGMGQLTSRVTGLRAPRTGKRLPEIAIRFMYSRKACRF